jgi:PqqA peptide cyclase
MNRFEQVVLEVTEACPHACLHCYNYWRENRAPLRSPETLSRKQIRTVIQGIKADTTLKHVGLSGGEPLLRPDLPGIVADLLEEDLGVLVITSGALLTPTRTAGFPKETAFEITLFSADAGVHDRIAGRAGAFARVVSGAICAARRGCPLAVSVVVNRINAQHAGDVLRLGVALGANTFAFNRVNFTRVTLPRAEELGPTPAQLGQALDAAEEFAAEYNTTVAVTVPIPPCVVDLTRYHRLLFGWCARGQAASYYTISHNGLLRPCNHSSRILGDLMTHSFGELVNSRKAAAFWAPVPSACQSCQLPDHQLCRGGCPAASDECYGTRRRWDPVVDLARNQTGLSRLVKIAMADPRTVELSSSP